MGFQQEPCRQLIRALGGFSNDLMGQLHRFVTEGDGSGVRIIWTCCITSLAHLAALCHLMSRMEPASDVSMDHLYTLAMNRLENLSLDVPIQDYSHFDVLTEVCTLIIIGSG